MNEISDQGAIELGKALSINKSLKILKLSIIPQYIN